MTPEIWFHPARLNLNELIAGCRSIPGESITAQITLSTVACARKPRAQRFEHSAAMNRKLGDKPVVLLPKMICDLGFFQRKRPYGRGNLCRNYANFTGPPADMDDATRFPRQVRMIPVKS